MRSFLTTVLQLVGLVSLVVGAALFSWPLGWAVFGLSCLVVGYLTGEA